MSTYVVRRYVLVDVLHVWLNEGVPLLCRLSTLVRSSTLEALMWVEWIDLAALVWIEESFFIP